MEKKDYHSKTTPRWAITLSANLKPMNMSNLLKLINLCKCSVIITVNEHRNSYTDINKYVEEYIEETEEDIINEIIKKDTIVELQVYPNTPNGFHSQ